MLTVELVRARVADGVVRPGFVDPGAARVRNHAEPLVALFRAHVGRTQGELDDALDDLLAEGGDLRIRQGLAKLLRDRCRFAPEVEVDPVALRREAFLLAGARHPVAAGRGTTDRAELLAEAAGRLDIAPETAAAGLYADLREAWRLQAFDDLESEDLLHRYNVALAQGVLLRASEVRVTLRGETPARYRQVFRWIKFFQLSFRAEPLRPDKAGAAPDGYLVTLDGPLSIFREVQRYGLSLAKFLPTLLLCRDWALEADVVWTDRHRQKLRLGPEDGLRTWFRDTGTWEPEEERWFRERFEARESAWRLEQSPRILSLGGSDVLIPDYVLRHQDGREALLEIVWTWRKGGLQRHVKHLAKHGPPNLVLAVSDAHRLGPEGEDATGLPEGVIRFKQVLRPKAVEDAAEKVGTKPG
jgi:hypothetical protein